MMHRWDSTTQAGAKESALRDIITQLETDNASLHSRVADLQTRLTSSIAEKSRLEVEVATREAGMQSTPSFILATVPVMDGNSRSLDCGLPSGHDEQSGTRNALC